jgi:hypothetical protein
VPATPIACATYQANICPAVFGNKPYSAAAGKHNAEQQLLAFFASAACFACYHSTALSGFITSQIIQHKALA